MDFSWATNNCNRKNRDKSRGDKYQAVESACKVHEQVHVSCISFHVGIIVAFVHEIHIQIPATDGTVNVVIVLVVAPVPMEVLQSEGQALVMEPSVKTK